LQSLDAVRAVLCEQRGGDEKLQFFCLVEHVNELCDGDRLCIIGSTRCVNKQQQHKQKHKRRVVKKKLLRRRRRRRKRNNNKNNNRNSNNNSHTTAVPCSTSNGHNDNSTATSTTSSSDDEQQTARTRPPSPTPSNISNNNNSNSYSSNNNSDAIERTSIRYSLAHMRSSPTPRSHSAAATSPSRSVSSVSSSNNRHRWSPTTSVLNTSLRDICTAVQLDASVLINCNDRSFNRHLMNTPPPSLPVYINSAPRSNSAVSSRPGGSKLVDRMSSSHYRGGFTSPASSCRSLSHAVKPLTSAVAAVAAGRAAAQAAHSTSPCCSRANSTVSVRSAPTNTRQEFYIAPEDFLPQHVHQSAAVSDGVELQLDRIVSTPLKFWQQQSPQNRSESVASTNTSDSETDVPIARVSLIASDVDQQQQHKDRSTPPGHTPFSWGSVQQSSNNLALAHAAAARLGLTYSNN